MSKSSNRKSSNHRSSNNKKAILKFLEENNENNENNDELIISPNRNISSKKVNHIKEEIIEKQKAISNLTSHIGSNTLKGYENLVLTPENKELIKNKTNMRAYNEYRKSRIPLTKKIKRGLVNIKNSIFGTGLVVPDKNYKHNILTRIKNSVLGTETSIPKRLIVNKTKIPKYKPYHAEDLIREPNNVESNIMSISEPNGSFIRVLYNGVTNIKTMSYNKRTGQLIGLVNNTIKFILFNYGTINKVDSSKYFIEFDGIIPMIKKLNADSCIDESLKKSLKHLYQPHLRTYLCLTKEAGDKFIMDVLYQSNKMISKKLSSNTTPVIEYKHIFNVNPSIDWDNINDTSIQINLKTKTNIKCVFLKQYKIRSVPFSPSEILQEHAY